MNELEIELRDNEWGSDWIMLYDHVLYTWDKEEDFETIQDFLPEGKLEIRQDEWPEFLKKKLSPITRNYSVDF